MAPSKPSSLTKRSGDWLVARLVDGAILPLRWLGVDRASAVCGTAARAMGRFAPPNRVGMANLRAAFPEKSDADLRRILAGVWENVGRVAGEFSFMDRLWDFDPHKPGGRIEFQSMDVLEKIRAHGRPTILFSGHLANWELPAVGAHAEGLKTRIFFRTPRNAALAATIRRMRSDAMGELAESNLAGVHALSRGLQTGHHVGILVDQRLRGGVPVTFFGRRCLANPLMARLARQFDCPVHGGRVVRLGGARFRVSMTEALELPRDEDGRVDVQPTMQLVTSMIESWIREEPSQWLWLYRRW